VHAELQYTQFRQPSAPAFLGFDEKNLDKR